jgi:hypothetical protein
MSKLVKFIREVQEPKELYERSEIQEWLQENAAILPSDLEYKIDGYKVIGVSGSITLDIKKKTGVLPVKFGIVKQRFVASYNKLTSMKGFPDDVGSTFNVAENSLTTLLNGPSYVNANYFAQGNQLVSLKGAPEIIRSDFDISRNQLITMSDGPSKVLGKLNVSKNRLTSFIGFPEYVGGDIEMTGNRITSLQDIHKHIKECRGILECDTENITGHVLGLLMIKGLKGLRHPKSSKPPQWVRIIHKYLVEGNQDGAIYDAQEELIEAGLEEYAKL